MVGFQNRKDTFTGKLAYVIYYDEKGKLRKEHSWQNWRDRNIDPQELVNEPTTGFVLNKKVGGYCLGNIYPDSYDKDSYEGSAAGMEVIMRIMDIVGVSRLEDMKGKYVRVATKKWGDTVKIIGNIIKDRWFDYQSFYADKKEESK